MFSVLWKVELAMTCLCSPVTSYSTYMTEWPYKFFGIVVKHPGWVSGLLLSYDAFFSSRNFCGRIWSLVNSLMCHNIWAWLLNDFLSYLVLQSNHSLSLLPRRKLQQNPITPKTPKNSVVSARHEDSLFWPFKPNSSLACHFSPSKWLLCCRS